MRISKIMVVALPLMLGGCDFFDSESDSFYSPSPTVAPAPAPAAAPPPPPPGAPGGPGGPGAGPGVPPRGPGAPPPGGPGKPSDCGCPGTDKPQSYYPSPTPCPVVAPDPDWKPSEHQLVQAGDLIVELRANQGNPSHAAMSTHIQTRMGLTAPQAERVLEEMGL